MYLSSEIWSTFSLSKTWNNELEECDEYKLEFRTKESLFTEIENEIKKIHDYEIAEISYYEIKGGNMEFLHWIDQNNLK